MTTHAISADYTRFDRMSPSAVALAVLLHVLTALALWWLPQLTPFYEPQEEAIDVTIEQPTPPPPEPTPPKPPEVKPSPPPPPPAKTAEPPMPKGIQAPLGLPPPSPTTGDVNKQSAPKEKEEARKPAQPMPPEPAKTEAATPEPAKPAAAKPEPTKPVSQPEPKAETQQALAPKETMPAPSPAPPPLERAMPPLEAPPPPLTSKDFPKLPPPPPPAPVHPQVRTTPPPPAPHPAPAPNQALRPSPLTNPAQPKRAPNDSPSNAPSTAFVNPADTYSQAKIVEQYLWQVAARISQFRYYSNQANEQGVVVIRLVITREGHLLDVSVARSSGIVNLDKGVVDAARAAAPYAPFPEGIPGAQQAFILPLSSVYRR